MPLRFSLLNAKGLISRRTNKLKSPELKQLFNTGDLVLFTESWTDKNSDLEVNKFEHFVLNSKHVKANSRRNSVGIVHYVRNKFASSKTLVFISEDDFLWLKLSKTVLFSDKDIYVCLFWRTIFLWQISIATATMAKYLRSLTAKKSVNETLSQNLC